MAIDTENKRRSAISSRPSNMFYHVPDGTINADDRRQGLGFYRRASGTVSLPAIINVQQLLADRTTYPRTDMTFDVAGTKLIWKDNGLYDTSTGVHKYLIINNVCVLI